MCPHSVLGACCMLNHLNLLSSTQACLAPPQTGMDTFSFLFATCTTKSSTVSKPRQEKTKLKALKTDEHVTQISESNIAEVKKNFFYHISLILIQSLSQLTLLKLGIHLTVVYSFPKSFMILMSILETEAVVVSQAQRWAFLFSCSLKELHLIIICTFSVLLSSL